MQIYTIGHSTHSIEEFLSLLKEHNIVNVVDVRSNPGSTKFPWFDQEHILNKKRTKKGIEIDINTLMQIPTMPEWLSKNGFNYFHIPELGGRRYFSKKTTDFTEVNGWRKDAFKMYAHYMQMDEFDIGINQLINIAKTGKTVYFCSEHTYKRCHRGCVSDHLTMLDWDVRHITNDGKFLKHDVTSFAVFTNGKVKYPSAQIDMFELMKQCSIIVPISNNRLG